MSSRFGVILLSLVVIFAGIFFINKNKANAPTNGSGSSSAQPTNHTKGSSQKGVTLVGYGDFQCPACGAIHPIVKEVVSKYANDITFQFVNYPLTAIHQNAMAAHRAAEAADKQGKYWEMYDLLYGNQTAWSASTSASGIFEGYAAQLGLDATKYKEDAASSAVNDVINADTAKARKMDITATPTFFVNDKQLDPTPQSVEEFSKYIDEAIKAKNG